MNREVVAGSRRSIANSQISRALGSARTVAVDACLIRTGSEKAERNFQVARDPVSHASEIPGVVLPTRHSDEFSRIAVHHASLIPDSGDLFQKIHAGVVIEAFRVVGNHLQRAEINDVHCELVRARALAHRVYHARLESVARGVIEAAWSVIKGAAEHTGEG